MNLSVLPRPGSLPLPLFLLVGAAVPLSMVSARPVFTAPPPAEKKPVTDVYHGVRVTDDYRWLEESAAPAVREWTRAQTAAARKYLDALPDRARAGAELTALYARETPSWSALVSRPGRLFALKFQPPKQQRLLVCLASAEDTGSEKVVLDPNLLAPEGQVSMDWFVPSPDGKLVAVCLSGHGSEEGTLHFYRTETGELLPDRIARVQYPTGGGSAAWTADGTAVFYTRYPRAGERPAEELNFHQQVYCHVMGRPEAEDRYVIGRDFPRIAGISLDTSPDGQWLLASVGNGDGGQYAHCLLDLRNPDLTAWHQISRFPDGVKESVFSGDSAALYLRSVKGAPRGAVLRLPLPPAGGGPGPALAEAEVIVPQSGAVIEFLTPTADRLYVTELTGGPSRIRQFTPDGKNEVLLPLPETAGVGGVLALKVPPGGRAENSILFRVTSHTAPAAWFSWSGIGEGGLKRTALYNDPPADFSDIEAVREYAVSRDGTRVPVNILRRKGTPLNGTNPLLLTGYGGYGISLRPGFSPEDRLWFDRGGVMAVAG